MKLENQAVLLVICSSARAPVTQLVRASDQNSEGCIDFKFLAGL